MWHIARRWATQGRAGLSTTSASIRWIRLSYTYPDVSSRVVVYWMKSHDMLGCDMDMGWWYCIWLYDENVLALAYPVYCMIVLYVVLLSCDGHQFDWWEQIGEVLVANKGMVIPLLSHLGWSFLHVFFRVMALVSLYAFLLYALGETCIQFSLASWYALVL